jgi:hypothetical protein
MPMPLDQVQPVDRAAPPGPPQRAREQTWLLPLLRAILGEEGPEYGGIFGRSTLTEDTERKGPFRNLEWPGDSERDYQKLIDRLNQEAVNFADPLFPQMLLQHMRTRPIELGPEEVLQEARQDELAQEKVSRLFR